MKAFLLAIAKAATVFFGYVGIHYTCAWILPLSSSAYTICANAAATLLFVLICLCRRQQPLLSAGAQPMRRTFWLAAAGVGVGGCLLVRLMMVMIPFPESWTQSYTERVELIQRAPAWVTYISAVAVAPIVEELMFRGLIYRRLKSGMPLFAAMLLSSALFAVLHGTIMWIWYTFLLGLVLCLLYEYTQSLWACITCHMAFNIMGQVSLVGILPDSVVLLVFSAGTVMFAMLLWYLHGARVNAPATPPQADVPCEQDTREQ